MCASTAECARRCKTARWAVALWRLIWADGASWWAGLVFELSSSTGSAHTAGFGLPRTRERQTSQAPVNLAKQQLEKHDFDLPDGNSLRINVSAEDACAPPGRDDAPQSFRHKTRFRYCHKGEITYDLTLVRSGATQAAAMAAPPEFEVRNRGCADRKTEGWRYAGFCWGFDGPVAAAEFTAGASQWKFCQPSPQPRPHAPSLPPHMPAGGAGVVRPGARSAVPVGRRAGAEVPDEGGGPAAHEACGRGSCSGCGGACDCRCRPLSCWRSSRRSASVSASCGCCCCCGWGRAKAARGCGCRGVCRRSRRPAPCGRDVPGQPLWRHGRARGWGSDSDPSDTSWHPDGLLRGGRSHGGCCCAGGRCRACSAAAPTSRKRLSGCRVRRRRRGRGIDGEWVSHGGLRCASRCAACTRWSPAHITTGPPNVTTGPR